MIRITSQVPFSMVEVDHGKEWDEAPDHVAQGKTVGLGCVSCEDAAMRESAIGGFVTPVWKIRSALHRAHA